MQTHIPCPDQIECKSSDAATLYDDGHTFCFSCKKAFYPDKENRQQPTEIAVMEWRGITAATQKAYGCYFLTRNGEPVEFVCPHPFGNKHRMLPKKFYTSGDMKQGQLFGQDRFPAGSAKAVTIYEGCEDAMSGYQMTGSKYPHVSVRSSSSAVADCRAAFEWLNSFENIFLCLDNDQHGKDAARSIAAMFPFDKIKLVKLDKYKDANEFLQKGEVELFTKMWWNAKRYMPENIISSHADIDKILDEKQADSIGTYPFERLQEMTYGLRPGEVTLIKAMEGYGKTEFLRAIEYHLMVTTGLRLGIIHLEEPQVRTVKGLIGYKLDQPCHLPDCGVTKDEMKEVWRDITRENDRIHIYKGYGHASPDEILNSIRFLVSACGCKVIFLDHISMLVASPEVDDERLALDYLSTSLEKLAEELQFALVEISHVNDDGQTRGSRNISKAAHLVLSLHRDLLSEDVATRNTTNLLVEKNRFASHTGPAGQVYFDPATFKLTDRDLTFGVPQE